MENIQTNSYMKVLEAFSIDELKQISQVKRFFECYDGDAAFRKAIDSGSISDDIRKHMKQIGIEFDPEDLALLWEDPESIREYVGTVQEQDVSDNPVSIPAELKAYPLLALWLRFARRRKFHYRQGWVHRFSETKSKRYENWRKRRIASAESELGGFNHFIDHPSLAIELSEGCSVQCWFCSFNAKKFKNNLDYEKSRDFFRGIVKACTDILGAKTAGLALLYYATEPHDNPHYIDYMRVFTGITGADVCTSTAVCTDKKWIDDLLAYYRPRNLPWPRLSVLSTPMLHKVHNNHTPWDLMHVNMIMQMKDSEREKVSGGRILEQKEDMRSHEGGLWEGMIPQGTIACVSGFYINLVSKTIKLVSPCYTSKKWPYGYRVFDEAAFVGVEDFRSTMLEMIENCMPEDLPEKMPLKLRDDLVCRVFPDGFDLVSPNQIHHFRNKSIFKALAGLLTGPPMDIAKAIGSLTDQSGQNPFEVHAVLQNLFHGGFLDEVCCRKGFSDETILGCGRSPL